MMMDTPHYIRDLSWAGNPGPEHMSYEYNG
jgi:hypothetical protein